MIAVLGMTELTISSILPRSRPAKWSSGQCFDLRAVDNAIKFTDRGEVVVSIAVAGSSLGIPAGRLQNIFRHVTQAESGAPSPRRFR